MNNEQPTHPTGDLLDASPIEAGVAKPAPRPNAEMARVLDELGRLGGQPIETLDAERARQQPTPADAVKSLIEKGVIPEPAAAEMRVADRTIPGPAGDIEARVYTPAGAGPFAVVVYYHGGGWVIADLDTYDASARALCAGTGAIIVSSHYRQAPEHRFPAAHDDAFAAYKWVLENAESIGGRADRVAVAGESAGGNMAAAVCLMARDAEIALPKHQLLVYPVTSTSLDWPSMEKNADAKPLNTAMMPWFLEQYAPQSTSKEDPRLDLMSANLRGLPPATIITAEIDPLQSEGMAFAEKLETAGVTVNKVEYRGVTHEFFGMAAAVREAREAQQYACERLKSALDSRVDGERDRAGRELPSGAERAPEPTRDVAKPSSDPR